MTDGEQSAQVSSRSQSVIGLGHEALYFSHLAVSSDHCIYLSVPNLSKTSNNTVIEIITREVKEFQLTFPLTTFQPQHLHFLETVSKLVYSYNDFNREL